MKRFLAFSAITACFVFAFATVNHQKVFVEHYKISKDSNLGKAKCTVCHLTLKGGKLNPYGKDLQKGIKASGQKKLTDEILKGVEKLDSNKNGVSNIDEIKHDKLPGAEAQG